MEPSEIDTPEYVKKGEVNGVKNAAVRKLGHELGIPADQVPLPHLKFLTRLHYWAADTVTHGTQAPWGEHEIDYVLFWVADKDKLTIQHHPEEIDDTRWVSMDELKSMLADESLLFSPWFRLICEKWLYTWWADLDAVMATDKYCDYDAICEFDPPPEHLGGGGNAEPLFLQGDSR